jgi:hypothetical protein
MARDTPMHLETNGTVRAARGFTELEIIGWVEKPTYTAATHRLVWSMSAKDKGAPADAPVGINYNTYALGREGYVSMNLLTSLNKSFTMLKLINSQALNQKAYQQWSVIKLLALHLSFVVHLLRILKQLQQQFVLVIHKAGTMRKRLFVTLKVGSTNYKMLKS